MSQGGQVVVVVVLEDVSGLEKSAGARRFISRGGKVCKAAPASRGRWSGGFFPGFGGQIIDCGKLHWAGEPAGGFRRACREVPDQGFDEVFFLGRESIAFLSQAGIDGNGFELLAGALREEVGVRRPVLAHLHAEVVGDSIEDALAGIEFVWAELSEGDNRQIEVQSSAVP